MSEPTRWRDDGPDDVRRLLRDAPRARPMSAEQRARTTSRVARLAATGAALGSLVWLQGAAFGAGLGVVTVVVGQLAFGWFTPPAAPVPPPPAIRAPAGVVGPAAPPPASAAPSTEPSAPSPFPRAPKAEPAANEEPPAPRPPADSLAEEAALLEKARTALGSSPAEALALAERHAAEFPAGKLSIERELVVVDALRRQGRAAEARARGEAVLARAKGSLYEERIRRLLGGL